MGEAYAYTDWKLDKMAYSNGLKAVGVYRRFKSLGANIGQVGGSRERFMVRWQKADFRTYDFGGSSQDLLDFYYFANSNSIVRPSNCFDGCQK